MPLLDAERLLPVTKMLDSSLLMLMQSELKSVITSKSWYCSKNLRMYGSKTVTMIDAATSPVIPIVAPDTVVQSVCASITERVRAF